MPTYRPTNTPGQPNSAHQSLDLTRILHSSALPRPETEILLAFLSGQSREFLLTHPETAFSRSLYKKFRALEKKRLAAWPIAYLVGNKEFYNLNFRVDPAVLVPRPETEMIVDEILADVALTEKQKKPSGTRPGRKRLIIVDIGTGSGAIIIAAAQELKRLFPAVYKTSVFGATDISPTALKIAAQNARRHRLADKIKFYRGDLLAPFRPTLKKYLADNDKNDSAGRLLISANLPYLTPAQIKNSPSIRREPRLALNGGRDGLRSYEKLFRQLNAYDLSKIAYTVLCEIDPGQTKKIRALAKKYFPAAEQELKKDLAQKNRLLVIKKNSG
ncbi:TPA: hypothetical protein DCZ15_03485 [Candidatus Falkowbacteria bacterium]|nr:MAG: Release factor glutamine methyltransferase [Candidatus Falkowbacteria bacterium GW2011_GWF2_43_32]HBA36910.1 hypothetical protein [Candidatus Falkowbacteria bacterium]